MCYCFKAPWIWKPSVHRQKTVFQMLSLPTQNIDPHLFVLFSLSLSLSGLNIPSCSRTGYVLTGTRREDDTSGMSSQEHEGKTTHQVCPPRNMKGRRRSKITFWIYESPQKRSGVASLWLFLPPLPLSSQRLSGLVHCDWETVVGSTQSSLPLCQWQTEEGRQRQLRDTAIS